MTPAEPVTYNADYFLAKFEAIPEGQWITGDFNNEQGCCARGFCGERADRETEESEALCELSRRHLGFTAVAFINDGRISERRHESEKKAIAGYTQETPKQRVLAWLRDAKEAGL